MIAKPYPGPVMKYGDTLVWPGGFKKIGWWDRTLWFFGLKRTFKRFC